MTEPTSQRVDAAAARVDEATRAARRARIAAAEPLRARARRRSTQLMIGLAVAGIVALVLLGTVIGVGVHNRAAAGRAAAADDALAAARTSVTTLLTADPADPAGYLERVLAVTTGAQHQRVQAARAALAAEISGHQAPSTGQILSAGLVTDPGSGEVGAQARVLVVAEATDPQLVGGDPSDRQITVEVTMVRTDSGWRIDQAAPA
ncbi:hypothetical protein AAFP35_05515 [Gordonia sp. CPCC 206044]|uniref:hypothetical protein n=1 Tax=Gordonia sp. CPCC 206044 TaxID=3140793 RepID=UPI003AF3FFFD